MQTDLKLNIKSQGAMALQILKALTHLQPVPRVTTVVMTLGPVQEQS